ncbi:MAG: hypothetical protein LBD46_01400 [Endomicrobium sp.]|jgi:hypothetical protein|nr:hypothetical protein [Endomicrobium sp.]
MKKILALVVLSLFVASSYAQELSFENLHFYGEGSFNGFIYENSTLNTSEIYNVSGTGMYLTIGLRLDIYEDIIASFALGYTNMWGDGSEWSGRPLNGNRGLIDLFKIVEANMLFNNLFDVDGLSFKIGRQYYGDEDSTVVYIGIRRNQPLYIVIGAADVPGTIGAISSIDAAAAYYDKDNIKANLIYGIMENRGADGNRTLIGGDFKYLNIAEILDLQGYLYNFENYVSAQDHYTILGVKPTVKIKGLKASLEVAKNFGGEESLSNETFNTNFIKADASYVIENLKLTPRVSLGVFGGENKPFITIGNCSAGLIVSRVLINGNYSDNRIINTGVDYEFKKFVFSFDIFSYDSRDGEDLKNNVKFGTEFDLTAKCAYAENIDFYFGIGHLFGADFSKFKNGGKDSFDSSTLQAGITYKFN